MTRLTGLAALLCCALLAPRGAAQAGGAELERVLAAARRAAGSVADPQAQLNADGRTQYQGTEAPFTLAFDPSGRFEVTVGGQLAHRLGYDGRQAWRVVERDGVPYPLDLWRGDVAVGWVSVWSGAWLDPTFPFEVSLDEAAASEDTLRIHFRSKTSSYGATLDLDAQTFLPRRLDLAQPWAGDASWTFDDYDAVAGARVLARTVVRTEEGGITDRFRVAAAAVLADAPAPGARPPLRPVNVEFDHAAPRELRVRHAPSGWLLIRPRVDDEDLGWFVFDTGAPVSVIEEEAADRLALPQFGSGTQAGAGPRITKTVLRQGTSLQLGPLRLREPVFVQMNLGLPTGTEPARAAGVLGWDILIQTVVEMDMDAGTMSLHPADSYELPAGEWRDLVLHLGHPHVEARFDGHAGLFRIDSGAGGSSVMFHAPAVQRLHLLNGRKTTKGFGFAAGGPITYRVGRIDWFEIAGHRVRNPSVRFSTDEKGALADPNSLGNMGGALLQPFVLVFDYQRQRVGFVPRRGR